MLSHYIIYMIYISQQSNYLTTLVLKGVCYEEKKYFIIYIIIDCLHIMIVIGKDHAV